MVVINEWLPNPEGADAQGEWVELRNIGSLPVDLGGWRLTSDGKKFFVLSGSIRPGEHLLLPSPETKIVLRNSDGRLALYDALGRLVDQAEFLGTAPQGESVNRSEWGFLFARPTPGAPNATVRIKKDYDNQYDFGVPLNAIPAAPAGAAGHLLGTALALTAAIMFILKSHEDLSNIFFGRD